jgi:pullulanase
MDKLANAIVMTSQGTAFMHAGAEMLRTKNEAHNSYNLPDSINQIDWNWKVSNAKVVDYYKNLILLRKQHPAFRMTSADEVREKLSFKRVENGLISYQISDFANGDTWKNIFVVYNAKTKPFTYQLQGEWELAVLGDNFQFDGNKMIKGSVKVPATSMMVAFQK